MNAHFTLMAEYNAWANARLYAMASRLPDEQYRRNVGAYFKSLHGTLNHILVADRIWMHRLTGAGQHPTRLDEFLFDELSALSAAREQEDRGIIRFVAALSDDQLEETCEFRTLNGTHYKLRRREILAHVFNHQTHHRGQAHTVLTVLGVAEPDSLDLLVMLRERG